MCRKLLLILSEQHHLWVDSSDFLDLLWQIWSVSHCLCADGFMAQVRTLMPEQGLLSERMHSMQHPILV